MKTQNIQDERVIMQRRKINSEAYSILMIVLFGSIFVQQFLLKAPFEQYAVEVICFFGISIYVLVRYWMLGLNIYDEEKRAQSFILVNSIVAGFVVTLSNGVLNYIRYAEHYYNNGIGLFVAVLIITFFSATVFSFAVQSCLNYINNKRQIRVQKQLEEDEQDE